MPAARGQGQWALGYREPLNANEQSKKDSSPLTVKQRILDIYSKGGFDSIDGGDLRGRFRWYGLYTQRAEGIAGGKTAILEPEELEAPFFMLRVRIDGGQLTNEQLRAIGEIATEFGRDVADVTDRQNVQLHWIRIEDVPEIWRRLEEVGRVQHELPRDLPCFRDPDYLVYGKSEAGGVLFGGYEPNPVSRWHDGVPWEHGSRMLPPDHARFQQLMAGAVRRFPFLDPDLPPARQRAYDA